MKITHEGHIAFDVNVNFNPGGLTVFPNRCKVCNAYIILVMDIVEKKAWAMSTSVVIQRPRENPDEDT